MTIIGRKDKIELPEFNLKDIDAKIDTGAYGSALHCHKVEIIQKDNQQMLSFQLLDPTHPEYENKIYTTHSYTDKIVKSSTGISEHRFVIHTPMILFGAIFMMEFSLSNRKEMRHPVLLGRKFLRKRFLVDVRKKNLSHTQNKKLK
jgi:hypothetical protein